MSKYSKKPLPCVCGAEAKVKKIRFGKVEDGEDYWAVGCPVKPPNSPCVGFEVNCDTRASAIRTWNEYIKTLKQAEADREKPNA